MALRKRLIPGGAPLGGRGCLDTYTLEQAFRDGYQTFFLLCLNELEHAHKITQRTLEAASTNTQYDTWLVPCRL